jgi:hypothetical protein
VLEERGMQRPNNCALVRFGHGYARNGGRKHQVLVEASISLNAFAHAGVALLIYVCMPSLRTKASRKS